VWGWNVGELYIRVLECVILLDIGLLECLSIGLLDCWTVGLVDWWIGGLLDCWSIGVLAHCLVGLLGCRTCHYVHQHLILQYSA
jgi:hypothetical protein